MPETFWYQCNEEDHNRRRCKTLARVGITETVLRDAHQSLIATRMKTDEMLPIIEKLDKVGYHSDI